MGERSSRPVSALRPSFWPEPEFGPVRPARGELPGGAFGERFALGTAQFEVPPRKEMRAHIDEPVARIMTRRVVCARAEMDASLLRERLLDRAISGAPVVDDWGRVVGVVSRSDLLEHEVTARRGERTVGDIMTPMAFTLRAEASIAQAAALMAYEGVHRIVIVDDSGCVVGVLSALDVSRWIGWCAGFPVGREP